MKNVMSLVAFLSCSACLPTTSEDESDVLVPAISAQVELHPFVPFGDALANVVIRSRLPGTSANGTRVFFSNNSLSTQGGVDDDPIAKTVRIKFVTGYTTMQNVSELFAASYQLSMVGFWNNDDLLYDGDDEFVATLTGGVDATSVPSCQRCVKNCAAADAACDVVSSGSVSLVCEIGAIPGLNTFTTTYSYGTRTAICFCDYRLGCLAQ